MKESEEQAEKKLTLEKEDIQNLFKFTDRELPELNLTDSQKQIITIQMLERKVTTLRTALIGLIGSNDKKELTSMLLGIESIKEIAGSQDAFNMRYAIIALLQTME